MFYITAFSTVHPEGIPLVPVGSKVVLEFLTNVPVLATPLTQESRQFDAVIFVASILI